MQGSPQRSRSGSQLAVAAVFVALTVFWPTGAIGVIRYEDTGFDANDHSTNVDIRSTTRTVIQRADGHRILKIALRGYEDWPRSPDMGAGVIKLDTRGGPHSDAQLRVMIGDGNRCILGGTHDEYFWEVEGDWSACKVPFSWLRQFSNAKPNKEIRWRVVLRHYGDAPLEIAPGAPDKWYS